MMNPTPVMMNPTPVMMNPTPVMMNPTPVMMNPTPVMMNPTPVMMNPPTNVGVSPAPVVTTFRPSIEGLTSANPEAIAIRSRFPTIERSTQRFNPMRSGMGNLNPNATPSNVEKGAVAGDLSPSAAASPLPSLVAVGHHGTPHHQTGAHGGHHDHAER
jgi:hypothetical protein